MQQPKMVFKTAESPMAFCEIFNKLVEEGLYIHRVDFEPRGGEGQGRRWTFFHLDEKIEQGPAIFKPGPSPLIRP